MYEAANGQIFPTFSVTLDNVMPDDHSTGVSMPPTLRNVRNISSLSKRSIKFISTMKALKPSIFSLFALVTSPVYSVSQQNQQYHFENPSSITQPLLGFGTWNLKISDSNTTDVVSFAIQTGYRQIDCAAIYGNEVAVGKGIKDGLEKAGLKREEIWVTSKLWNDQ
jgi:hypothetical protein